MNKLSQKLNEASGGAYDFLKLSSVIVSKKERLAELTFVYKDDCQERFRSSKEDIVAAIKKIVGGNLTLDIKFVRSCFFANTFVDELIAYLECFPSICLNLTSENISIENNGDSYNIAIHLSTDMCDYAKTAGIIPKIKEHFSFKYWQTLNFELKERTAEQQSAQHITRHIKKMESETPQLENEGGRTITITDKILFVGGNIEGTTATYISDARVTEKAIHCGRIEELAIIPMKPKTPEDEERNFYKFKLRDFTAHITCLYFPPKKSVPNELNELCDGKSVLLSGRVVEDSYDTSKLTFMVRKIMLCTLPPSFTENRMVRKVADEYMTVMPKAYIKPVQNSFFDTKDEPPTMLKNKRFCVFDLETTGLDPKNSEIMEVGAVIIEDGEIKETFSSFASISTAVPPKIIQLTGITDSDLEGQPPLKDVLADFYKFSYGLPLVGQNVSFDYGFISEHGAKHHMHFDNERIDTIVLARKYLKNMRNFTLKSITEKLGITNDEAHRALSDALATAKAFIKLAKFSD